MSKALEKLCRGQVQEVIAEVAVIAQAVTDPKDRQKVEKVVTQLRKCADSVSYNELKAQGWPIASGAVEGSHVHIMHPIAKRGAGWLVKNPNAVIALACVHHSPVPVEPRLAGSIDICIYI